MADDLAINGVIPGGGTCCAPLCGLRVPKGNLMCGRHWCQVPTKARARVYAEIDSWENGSGTLGSLRDAQNAAVASLAEAAP
jgi:hypothetical protein